MGVILIFQIEKKSEQISKNTFALSLLLFFFLTNQHETKIRLSAKIGFIITEKFEKIDTVASEICWV